MNNWTLAGFFFENAFLTWMWQAVEGNKNIEVAGDEARYTMVDADFIIPPDGTFDLVPGGGDHTAKNRMVLSGDRAPQGFGTRYINLPLKIA